MGESILCCARVSALSEFHSFRRMRCSFVQPSYTYFETGIYTSTLLQVASAPEREWVGGWCVNKHERTMSAYNFHLSM